jgi:hypothetical protein
MTNHLPYRSGIAMAVLTLVGLISTNCLAAHPYHVSHAEVNWNQKTGNFEVALCLWPADLEKAIGIDQGKPVDLDKVENLDPLLQRYIAKKFLIRRAPAKGAATADLNAESQIRWVGHEKTIKEAWLYFEIKGDKNPAPWTIENRVFFELNDDQMNQVQLTIGSESNSLICARPNPRHKLSTGKVVVSGK